MGAMAAALKKEKDAQKQAISPDLPLALPPDLPLAPHAPQTASIIPPDLLRSPPISPQDGLGAAYAFSSSPELLRYRAAAGPTETRPPPLFAAPAPSASLDRPKPPAAPTHLRAPPGHSLDRRGTLESLRWPPQPASGRPKVEEVALATARLGHRRWLHAPLGVRGLCQRKAGGRGGGRLPVRRLP